MPYDVTENFSEEQVKLEQDQIMEMFVIDLASVQGYVSFNSSTKKIISRDRDGIFPTTRIEVGDIIDVRWTDHNNGGLTVTNVNARELTVSENLVDEGTSSPVFVSISNYSYYIKNHYNVYGYLMQAGELVNTEQLYSAFNIKREDITTEQKLSGNPLKLTAGNVNRVMESLVQDRSYLRGCFAYFVTSFRKHLPSGATYEYIGSSPDYLSNIVEKFKIDGVEGNEQLMSFNCNYKFDLRQMNLPRRKLDTIYCAWSERYGCVECDPTSAIDYDTYPTCDGTLVQCRERGNSRRYGGFPGIPKRSIYIG